MNSFQESSLQGLMFEFMKDSLNSNGKTIYRGQADANWDLLPKIAREEYKHKNVSDLVSIERKLLNEFKRCAYNIVDRAILKDDWDWISLMQHYGMPTRFLDWTINPLAALWFAFEQNNGAELRAVYIYRYTDSDELTFEEQLESPLNVNGIKVYTPNQTDIRMNVQNAIFTAHGIDDNTSEHLSFKTPMYNGKIIKRYIRSDMREGILKLLSSYGVNYYSLFPGLEGLANKIVYETFYLRQ